MDCVTPAIRTRMWTAPRHLDAERGAGKTVSRGSPAFAMADVLQSRDDRPNDDPVPQENSLMRRGLVTCATMLDRWPQIDPVGGAISGWHGAR
jgi:hypothetical protein